MIESTCTEECFHNAEIAKCISYGSVEEIGQIFLFQVGGSPCIINGSRQETELLNDGPRCILFKYTAAPLIPATWDRSLLMSVVCPKQKAAQAHVKV